MIELQIEIRENILEDNSTDGYEWIILKKPVGYGAALEDTECFGMEKTLEAATSKAIQAFKILKDKLNK